MPATFDTPHQPLTSMHVPEPLKPEGAMGANPARKHIAAMLLMMTQAVLFGVGAIVLLSGPPTLAKFGFPMMIALSIALAAIIAWNLAPRLQARYWRGRAG